MADTSKTTDTSKPQDKEKATSAETVDAMAKLQEEGFGNVMQMSTTWMEALSGLGAEMLGFVTDRIKEDAKTQQEILKCKNVADLQHVQAQFLQRTMDQYRAETGKLVEMSTLAFGTAAGADKS